MRFKKKPQYGRIVLGILIVLLALLSTHITDIHYFWSWTLLAFGIIQFSNGFLIVRKVQKRLNAPTKKRSTNSQ
jgi:hypothetical protein